MTSDEFLEKLSERLDINDRDVVSDMVVSLSDIISECLQNSNSVLLRDFGGFEVVNEKEHIVVDSTTKQRILVPPTLSVCFTASDVLSNKINVI